MFSIYISVKRRVFRSLSQPPFSPKCASLGVECVKWKLTFKFIKSNDLDEKLTLAHCMPALWFKLLFGSFSKKCLITTLPYFVFRRCAQMFSFTVHLLLTTILQFFFFFFFLLLYFLLLFTEQRINCD